MRNKPIVNSSLTTFGKTLIIALPFLSSLFYFIVNKFTNNQFQYSFFPLIIIVLSLLSIATFLKSLNEERAKKQRLDT
ncbi:hypothetical protein [Aliivibrio fischeri]|uniref:hypothetical protein n=1 Tax=Aliivibrio fischeri TaxID=668 RepID=UPI0007C517B7|nr:hypothetical protein [Aliivibrio fischeri]